MLKQKLIKSLNVTFSFPELKKLMDKASDEATFIMMAYEDKYHYDTFPSDGAIFASKVMQENSELVGISGEEAGNKNLTNLFERMADDVGLCIDTLKKNNIYIKNLDVQPVTRRLVKGAIHRIVYNTDIFSTLMFHQYKDELIEYDAWMHIFMTFYNIIDNYNSVINYLDLDLMQMGR